MQRSKYERGSVLVFVTLMMVLLFVIVGMGLDTGHLTYIRSQGQPAVDAAALAAVQALPTGVPNQVYSRAAQLNYGGSNLGGNNYLNSPNNLIGEKNVTFINYDGASGTITAAASIASANGVRVALESSNPYDGAATATPMKSPLFLTPLLNLMGQKTSGTQNVSVSAVAVLSAIPGFPVAIAGCSPPPVTAGCDVGGEGTLAKPYTNCKLLQVDSSNSGNGKGIDALTYQDSGWTTFTVPSANAPAIKELVRNNSTCGNIPPITEGACIYLNNGQITTVLNEFNSVYSNNGNGLVGVGSGNPVTPVPYYNDWGVIPVVDPNITNFNQCKPVIGWAKFGIRNIVSNSYPKYLIGDLICNWSLNNVGGTGCYTTQLVRDKLSGM